ncbi:carboxypeptidase regulatory-like domain-containing protein [Lysobacter humi (ex Lee et al. 2017)]
MIQDLLRWPASELQVAVGAMLALATLLAVARLLLRQLRTPAAQRSHALRVVVLVLAQPACAALLYVALFPPPERGRAGMLLVVTADATPAIIAGGPPSASRIALPEADPAAGLERVPDLATALRRYPGITRLRIVGRGLEPRDRDAVRGLAVEFVAAPLPRGLVEVLSPARVGTGASFTVSGRTHRLDGGTVELLDPAGRRIDRVSVGADGRFTLGGRAHAPGVATFALRLRDERRRPVESIDVPVLIDDVPATRVVLVAAAPGPEVKYLRRWMQDAGLQARSRIDAGGGLAIGDARLDTASLARTDVLVVDDRTWAALGEGGRATVLQSVRGGLGVLVRLTGAPSAAERRRFAALGFALGGDARPMPARVVPPAPDEDALRARLGPGTRDAPRAPDGPLPETPVLSRRDLQAAPLDGATLLRDVDGAPLGAWRTEGLGRIGLLTVVDSHRLVLAGRDDAHGDLWSGVLATLARPLSAERLSVEGDARPHRRLVLCNARGALRVTAPDGTVTVPLPETSRPSGSCAAFWPRQAGLHRVEAGTLAAILHVRRDDEAPGLHAHAVHEATERLRATAPDAQRANTAAAPEQPGRRWPWWLGWLLASGALWWLERARIGRRG